VAVVDFAQMQVAVMSEGGEQEIVSAALLVTPQQPLGELVGAYVLIHAGFALSVIDEAEARSRQQVVAAMRGGDGAIDLDDFYASTTTDVAAVPGLEVASRPLPDATS